MSMGKTLPLLDNTVFYIFTTRSPVLMTLIEWFSKHFGKRKNGFSLSMQLWVQSNKISSFPNEYTKLKAFADNKSSVTNMMIFVFDRVENIVGKGENADYQHFLLFPQYFYKTSTSGL